DRVDLDVKPGPAVGDMHDEARAVRPPLVAEVGDVQPVADEGPAIVRPVLIDPAADGPFEMPAPGELRFPDRLHTDQLAAQAALTAVLPLGNVARLHDPRLRRGP